MNVSIEKVRKVYDMYFVTGKANVNHLLRVIGSRFIRIPPFNLQIVRLFVQSIHRRGHFLTINIL